MFNKFFNWVVGITLFGNVAYIFYQVTVNGLLVVDAIFFMGISAIALAMFVKSVYADDYIKSLEITSADWEYAGKLHYRIIQRLAGNNKKMISKVDDLFKSESKAIDEIRKHNEEVDKRSDKRSSWGSFLVIGLIFTLIILLSAIDILVLIFTPFPGWVTYVISIPVVIAVMVWWKEKVEPYLLDKIVR